MVKPANTYSPSKLVIFAGGRGTRMGSLTADTPKPAVSVNGRPLVTYLIDWAFKNDIRTVILAAGYKQTELKRIVVDYYHLKSDVSLNSDGVQIPIAALPHGCQIIIRDTGQSTDTAERLWAVRDLVENDECFMLTYGDTLTNLDAKKVIAVSKTTEALVTLCAGRPDVRYGELEIDGNRVVEFREKERPKFYVNRGFFVIRSAIFRMWKESFTSFEHDVLPFLVSINSVSCHKDECWFYSVDTEKDLSELNNELDKFS